MHLQIVSYPTIKGLSDLNGDVVSNPTRAFDEYYYNSGVLIKTGATLFGWGGRIHSGDLDIRDATSEFAAWTSGVYGAGGAGGTEGGSPKIFPTYCRDSMAFFNYIPRRKIKIGFMRLERWPRWFRTEWWW